MDIQKEVNKRNKQVPSISKYFSTSADAGTIFDEITSNPSFQSESFSNPTNIFGQNVSSLNESIMKTLNEDNIHSPDLMMIPNVNANVIIESDRRREAWPCNNDDTQLTLPGVTIQDDLSDPIEELVARHLGGENLQRNLLTHADVTQDERGIRKLIEAKCYRAAINLTSRLLTVYGQGYGKLGQPAKHSPHSLQLWFTRIALLAKIGLFSVCKTEADAFGLLERRDIFFQHYSGLYENKVGSMASFSFRLLLAELPSHWQKPKESLDRLYKILAVIRKMLQNLNNNLNEYGAATPVLSNEDREESIRLWTTREARTLHSVINSALMLKNYSLATQILTRLTKSTCWGAAHRCALHSVYGRVLLQLGDILGAEKQFSISRLLKRDPDAPDLREMIDKGLVAVAQNSLQEAFIIFQKALSLDPTNIMVLNNMGVVLLYSGKVKEAIALLEKAINTNPVRGLNENLLINLCTLYELESSHSKTKKISLLRQINNLNFDMTGPVHMCLKLPV